MFFQSIGDRHNEAKSERGIKTGICPETLRGIFHLQRTSAVFSSLYEVLLAKSAQLSDVALLNLLNMSSGILEGMYRKWLGVKDHSYQELEEYVGHEVEDLEGYDLPEAV